MSGSIGDNVFRASGVIAAAAAGRTGTVDWDTTPKTGTVTAESAVGYFINTTSGGITVNLPAGAAGSIVAIADYTRTFNTNNCTVTPNGSEKIGGGDAGATVALSVNGQSATFVYVDGTEGWINVQETQTSQAGATALFVTATGGTPCTGAICGDFKTHVFTGPGTFCVSCAGNACGSTTVDYLVSAGGGGGGGAGGGGAGGAGGFRLSNSVGCIAAPVMSPLANPTGITVSATPYAIVVGGGGAAGPAPGPGAQGNTSSFSTISSAGGGLGYGGPPSGGGGVGGAGGSGGGGRGGPSPSGGTAYAGGAGDTPDVTPNQGYAGGAGFDGWTASTNGGGGGGAAAAGANSSFRCGGCGGIGSYLGDAFFGPIAPSYGTPGPVSSTRYFSGGGGGGTDGPAPVGSTGGTGGAGGGGDGPNAPGTGGAGTTNTGGGAGGAGSLDGGAGGPGIVAIRYKFQ